MTGLGGARVRATSVRRNVATALGSSCLASCNVQQPPAFRQNQGIRLAGRHIPVGADAAGGRRHPCGERLDERAVANHSAASVRSGRQAQGDVRVGDASGRGPVAQCTLPR